jgi:hypothetical protein
MNGTKETITVRVNLELAPGAVQAVVERAKSIAGQNEKGHYQVDTADLLEKMISRFLSEKNFEAYATNLENYPG